MGRWLEFLVQSRWLEWGMIAIILALCLPLFLNHANYLTPDGGLYMAEGLNLAVKGDYGVTKLEAGRPPLFPFLLAIVYKFFEVSTQSSFWIPKIFGLVNVLAIYLIGEKFFTRWTGFAAAGLVLSSAYLNEYFFTRILIDGPQVAMIQVALLYLLFGLERQKRVYFVVAAAAAAWAFLLKESMIWWLLLPAISFLTIPQYRSRRTLFGLVLFYLCFLILVGWWWGYVYLVSGDIYLVGAGIYSPLADYQDFIPAFFIVGLLSLAVVGYGLYQREKTFLLYRRYTKPVSILLVGLGGLLLFVFIAIGYSSFTRQMLENYWSTSLLPIVKANPVFYLFIPGWLYIIYLAIRYRNPITIFSLIYLFLHIPMVSILARWGNQPRNLLTLFTFSCLIVGFGLISAIKGGWRQAQSLPKTPAWILSAAVVLVAGGGGVMIVHQSLSFESALTTHKNYAQLSWSSNQKGAEWLRFNAPPDSDLMIHSLHFGELYFLTKGPNYNIFEFPVEQAFFSYAPGGQLFTDDDKIFVDIRVEWILDAKNYRFLSEQDFLNKLVKNEIDYIIYEGFKNKFGLPLSMDAYFESQPAYELMFRDGSEEQRLSIYKVDREKLRREQVTYIDFSTFSKILEEGRKQPDYRTDFQIINSIGPHVRLWANDPAGRKGYSQLGDIYLQAGMLELAAESYQKLTTDNPYYGLRNSNNPGDVGSLLSQAMVATLRTEHDTAISLYKQTIERNPEMVAPYIGLGDNYRALDRLDPAEMAYQKALTLDPNHQEANSKLGDIYYSQNEYQAAIDRYTIAAQQTDLFSVHQKLFIAQAAYWHSQGNLSQAVSYYRRAVYAPYLFFAPTAPGYIQFDLLQFAPIPADAPAIRPSFFYLDTAKPILFQHPPSQISYHYTLPDRAMLQFSIALSPETWKLGKGDGVQFEIYLDDGQDLWRPFSRYIDPKNVPADRKWHDYEISLSRWAGQPITLTLVTDPGPNDDIRFDWAGWGEPRIVQPIAYDFLARLPDADESESQQIQTDTLTITYEPRPVLFQHPPHQLAYRVDVPERAGLHFGLGLDPAVWSPDKGDGMAYNIYVRSPNDPAQGERLFHAYIDPKNNPADRQWLDQVVDLSGYGGQTVDIIFETTPGPAGDANFDWGGWSMPVLVADDLALQNSDSRVIIQTDERQP